MDALSSSRPPERYRPAWTQGLAFDDEELAYWGSDPDCGRPAELEGLSPEELDALSVPAGRLPGFAGGQTLDTLAPGVTLAGFTDAAHTQLGEISDDELAGVLRAWRRQASWAQAKELAAVAELARRRPHRGPLGEPPGWVSEFAADEIAAALMMTSLAAHHHLDLALSLADRRLTAAAFETGQIDLPRVRVILAALEPLTEDHAAAVEAAILPTAPGITTGQLRAAAAKAVLAVDPGATVRAREKAQKDARVEYGLDTAGTGALAGRCLPPAQALAADQRVSGIAGWWKKQGAAAGMDLLRARAFLALLLGADVTAPPADLLPAPAGPPGPHGPDATPGPARGPGYHGSGTGPGPDGGPGRGGPDGGPGRSGPDGGPGRGGPDGGPGRSGPDGAPAPAGLRAPTPGGATLAGAGVLPPLAGSVNLTLPLATLLGWSQDPGEAARYGPLDAPTARQIALAAAGSPATRWHLTITGPDGRAVAHGCAGRRKESGPGQGWRFTLDVEPIARGDCGHRNAEPGYRPSPRLAHLTHVRTTRCAYPGCRRPAVRCDDDHTIPHDQDGLTCECNLAPLCRFHHRLKQSEGWALEQAQPGVMTWTTPARRRYTTQPTQY